MPRFLSFAKFNVQLRYSKSSEKSKENSEKLTLSWMYSMTPPPRLSDLSARNNLYPGIAYMPSGNSGLAQVSVTPIILGSFRFAYSKSKVVLFVKDLALKYMQDRDETFKDLLLDLPVEDCIEARISCDIKLMKVSL